jgi:ferric-dicitrate binding protein FerR (iron transport regulator)
MTNFEKDIDIVLLSKYLNKETSQNENIQVEQWKATSSENMIEFQKLQKSWELATAGIAMDEWEKESSKEKLLFRIIKSQSITATKEENWLVFSKDNLLNGLKYAAVIIFAIGIPSLLIYNILYSSGSDNYTQKFTQISAPRGSKIVMSLTDGSKVWLNAGSVLKYNEGYNKQNRDIFLEGEAYFEVAKNKDNSFIVHAGDIDIQAWGTTFNVKAYNEEKVIETTLIEGSVSVSLQSKPDDKISLFPNEQVFYYKPDKAKNENSKILKTKGVEVASFTSWIDDKLQISSETLEILAVKLERKYNVKINFEDKSLRKMQFTGILENETIEQIFEIIKISSLVQYRIDGREIWLLKKQKTD